MGSNYKQVIVIRRDLGMRRGKECAQAAHASGEILWRFLAVPNNEKEQHVRNILFLWKSQGMTKICVRVDSEDELREIVSTATECGIPTYSITDSGKTEFGGVPTLTCAALGPDEVDKIDAITGHLKLM